MVYVCVLENELLHEFTKCSSCCCSFSCVAKNSLSVLTGLLFPIVAVFVWLMGCFVLLWDGLCAR